MPKRYGGTLALPRRLLDADGLERMAPTPVPPSLIHESPSRCLFAQDTLDATWERIGKRGSAVFAEGSNAPGGAPLRPPPLDIGARHCQCETSTPYLHAPSNRSITIHPPCTHYIPHLRTVYTQTRHVLQACNFNLDTCCMIVSSYKIYLQHWLFR